MLRKRHIDCEIRRAGPGRGFENDTVIGSWNAVDKRFLKEKQTNMSLLTNY